MQAEYYRTSMHGSAARAALRPVTEREIIAALVAALESMKRIAGVHMRARGFSAEDIEEAFPQTDAALLTAHKMMEAE